ncbi:tRNA pseudouridine(13) synthase TruD [Thiotrichales bacterium 19S3-7]|nr:tRNA pseudouridine(13) synthase TruD [Thiotrichales bacterium 19S3-7]MCF6801710.1 tRNA pseudouridine(13) synthase TruD [Thiotrichales bacterium 19S3-11]
MPEITPLGEFKSSVDDFLVTELLDIDFSNNGEHHWVYLRKENLHTEEVAKLLAKFAGIAVKDVGYSGMKDKYAITEQWFSLYMPGEEAPNWQVFNVCGISILKSAQHQKKLRRKLHYGNWFNITIRNATLKQVSLAKAIHHIKTAGVPNYYGQQRFGYEHSNIQLLNSWFKGEVNPPLKRKKWLLSVYRSYLFNLYLDHRRNSYGLSKLFVGDIMQFERSNSVYQITSLSELDEAYERLEKHQAYPVGPLWGQKGKLFYSNEAEQLLDEAFKTLDVTWLDPPQLKPFKLTLDYRSLVLMPEKLTAHYNLNEQLLKLTFILPAGGYATTVLDYLGDLVEDVYS